ncbi:MAG: ISNCY family transposase [Deltaproteobacteria bacterium]|nr:ISNCY family transposase [Deltaproteobacteria bacterium]
MRRKPNRQMNLFTTVTNNPIARELEEISKIIDGNPGVLDLVYKDLVKAKRHDTGREGLTAEQVLRCCILKQYHQPSYEELAFYLDDSSAFRTFSRLEMGQYPCKSILQENIKSLSEETWEAIHSRFIDYAQDEEIETGKKIRIDSTAIETEIHHPTDSTLLCDGIRAVSRWLSAGKQLSPRPVYPFSDHTRAAKKRLMVILNTRKEKVRLFAYRALLSYAERVVVYAETAIPALWSLEGSDSLAAHGLASNLERAVGILRKVVDQTVRRVLRGERIPASEKVVSFFEEHTDIIVKGCRDVQYGHKVFLTGGASNLIMDCLIERSNPADSDRYQALLERHKEQFGRVPRQVSADGGFASRNNLAFAKGHEVKDAVFAKKRGLSVIEMAKSAWVYKMLRNFRAGIEAGISTLKKQVFGLDRCTWSGWGGFKQYVWSSIFSYNLLVLARARLAKA